MGGELFLGIKRADGREQCSLRWTNIIPYFFAHPEMYEEGAMFEELWDRPSPNNSWPQSVLVTKIVPSEYGAIFYDGVNKKILSLQDYCSIGLYSVSLLTEDSYDLFGVLLKEGRINGSKVLGNHSFEDVDKNTTISEVQRWIKERLDYPVQYCQLEIDTRPFDVVHRGVSAAHKWGYVLNWLKENNWKSSALSLDEVWDQKDMLEHYDDKQSYTKQSMEL